MTDRYNALIVVLENDIREDDAENILNAIRQIRGVLSVTGNVSDIGAHIAEQRIRNDLSEKIWDVLNPKSGVERP